MSASRHGTPIYDVEITAIGPLVAEFTAAGIWVLFRDDAPTELAEFALLHHAAPPRKPIVPGQVLEVGGQQFAITAVGPVANDNLRELGHLVLKATAATEAELPGDVCIEAGRLPEPVVGIHLRIWAADEVADETA